MKKALAILIAILLVFSGCEKKSEKFTKYTFDYFDTASTIIGYEKTEEDFLKVYEKIEKQLSEYHKLFDIYKSYPDLNNIRTINLNADKEPVKVDNKIIDLLLYCSEAYKKTEGKTNVMLGSVLSIWHNYRAAGENNPQKAALPSYSELKEASEHIAFDSLVIDKENSTVFIKDSKASLDVGAVAKGYAVEMIAQSLEKEGISGYLLNIGGNIRCIGRKPDGKFKVGIENPDSSDSQNPHIAYLELENMSLVTSGSYQRFYTVNGKNYHHIIDPQTLFPSEYFVSVSVLSLSSADGDALSTALFSLPLESGKKLIEGIEDCEAMWVLKNGEKIFSSGFEGYTFEYQN